jgi:hypothetical protein
MVKMELLKIACDESYNLYTIHRNKIAMIKQVKLLVPELSLIKIRYYVRGYINKEKKI